MDKSMRMMEANKELVKQASFETYTEGNTDVIDELVSDSYVLHDPTSPEAIRGREAFKEHVESIRRAFPDLTTTIEHTAVEGDLVAVQFTVGGTHEGPFPDLDLEPTGETFEMDGMEFDRIEDGQLAETWLVFDSLAFAQQLGAVPDEDSATVH